MKTPLKYLTASLVFIYSLMAYSCNTSRQNHHSYANPGKVTFSYHDIANFWKAYDQCKGKSDSIQQLVYNDEYFKKGSIGLKDFLVVQDLSRKEFVSRINSARSYFDMIRETTIHVSKYQHAILSSMVQLKKIYPHARFPNIYFLVVGFKSGGTVSNRGILIGTEFWSLPSERVVFDFPLGWMKNSIRTPENIPYTAAHELLHFQQYSREFPTTLLGKCLVEGSADFVGELISGRVNNRYLYQYGSDKEKLLWHEFKKDMMNNDYSKWIYNLGTIKDRPPDLGYYIGYKICESYYLGMKAKSRAIREIIEMKDYEKFLRMSKYDEKFR
ncbi:MAG: DUF2268 domain-containing putative Zn-dependent protease [Ginsengibacter sp.]